MCRTRVATLAFILRRCRVQRGHKSANHGKTVVPAGVRETGDARHEGDGDDATLGTVAISERCPRRQRRGKWWWRGRVRNTAKGEGARRD